MGDKGRKKKGDKRKQVRDKWETRRWHGENIDGTRSVSLQE